MLVIGTHARRRRSVDVGGDVTIPPEPGIGTSEAYNRYRFDAGKLFGVVLQDLDHLTVGIAIGGWIEIDLLQGHLGMARQDLMQFLRDGFFLDAERQADIGLDPALAGYHVDL